MSQKILEQMQEQKKKQLTFEQICPLWDKSLKNGKLQKGLDLINGQFCIVGEAHGFSTKRYGGCLECNKFSYGNGQRFFHQPALSSYWVDRRNPEFQHLKNKFVEHFNECHVT